MFDHTRITTPPGSLERAIEIALIALLDNCDLSRIAQPTEQDYKRLEKYRRALVKLDGLERETARAIP